MVVCEWGNQFHDRDVPMGKFFLNFGTNKIVHRFAWDHYTKSFVWIRKSTGSDGSPKRLMMW